MKVFKKLLAVVLSLAMVLGTLTVTAQAANIKNQTIDATGTYDMTENWYGSSGIALSVGLTTSDINVTVNAGSYQIYNKSNANNTIKTKATSLTVNSPDKMIYNYVSDTEKQANATVNVIGGTLTIGAGTKVARVTSADVNTPVNGKTVLYIANGVKAVHLNGAIIAGKIAGTKANIAKDITSGFFYDDLSDYCAEGYECVAMTVAEKTTYPGCRYKAIAAAPKTYVCEIDGTQYETIKKAVAAASDGDTIKMIADYAVEDSVTTIPAGTKITLDLNGCALTNVYSNTNKASTNHRYFTVAGTLVITDTSAAQTGSITGHAEYTGNAAITFCQATGTVNIDAGTYCCAPNGAASNNCFSRASGGTCVFTGGWYDENSYCSTYTAEGYNKVEVTDESKAASPITLSNTTKTINYLKNGGSGTDVQAQTYAYVDGYTTEINTRSLTYTLKGSTCVGWSTNSAADPDGTEIIGGGDLVNFADSTKFPGDTVDLYAIYKTVDPSMWVCIDTDDNTVGYADIASAFAESTDVTLIKNYNGRASIEVSGDRRLNLNGYNIVANTAEDPTGSAIVAKISGGALSIYNEDAGIAAYPFGGEGIVEGYAQGTGGAVDVIGSVGASVKIYGGTFTGDAPNHGTVLTNSGVGKAYIYGGTFIPANAESEIDSLYANTGKIFIMADTQSDVKIQGVMAKASAGMLGIVGGYFSDLQPAATIGTYDSVNDRITADATKKLVTNTGDTTYPYSVGDIPWYITYDYGTGTAPETANPAMVAKDDATVITLNAPTPAAGYTFTGWTDADGNTVTAIQGTALTADLALTANYEVITYTITYDNLYDATAPEKTTFTIEENVTLETIANRAAYIFNGWHTESKTGPAITGWSAGEQTDNITVYAGWSSPEAYVTVGETTMLYASLADAVAAVKDSTEAATLKLGKNVTVEERLDLGKQVGLTLDLNGKTLTQKTETKSGFFVYGGALTIKDTDKDGKMVQGKSDKTAGNKSIVCQREDATLTIESGSFEGFTKVTSNGSSKTPGAGSILTGGTYNFDPSTDEAATIDTALYQLVKKDATETTAESWTVYAAAAQVTVGEVTTGYRYMKSSTEAYSALDNVVDGSTLTLLKDASATYEFNEAMTFTLNKNGFKYSNSNLTGADGLATSFAQIGETDSYTVTVAAATTAKFATASYKLGTQLVATFTVHITPLADDIGKTVTFKTTAGYASEAQTITGEGDYTFTNTIDLTNLGTKVKHTVMLGDKAISVAKSYSFVDYAVDAHAAAPENEALSRVLADTLNVGSKLQAYCGKGTAFEVPTELASFVGTAQSTSTVKANVVSATSAKLKIKSATLRTDKQISLVFNVLDSDHYNFKLDVNGTEYKHSDLAYVGDGIYQLVIDIAPSEYSKTFDVKLYNDDGGATELMHEITYSANSYCNSKKGNALADAVYNYGVSATAYYK